MSTSSLDQIISELDQGRPSSRFRSPAPGVSLSEGVRRNLDIIRSAVAMTREQAQAENRGLHRSEQAGLDKADDRIEQLEQRLAELQEGERREALAAQARVDGGSTGVQRTAPRVGGALVSGGETYHPGPNSPSFFADLIHSRSGSADSADRLRRNNAEVGMETRALGNTGGVGGSGGEFAPPGWIENEWVKLARPGRVTADRFRHLDLPAGISTVNIPKVATGTTVALQSTQNTSLAQTDMTTQALSSPIVTHGGKQVVSRQLLDQSAIAFDRVILEDLAADHSRAMGVDVLTGSGTGGQLRGYLTPASTSVNTWTTASPTASAFYGRLAALQGTIAGSRYKAPDTVIMHPRRFAWFASFTDSTGRPLIVPTSGGFNALANRVDNLGVGHVGNVLGMDIFCDPAIPVTLGAGANQDVVLMMVADDIVLWESPLQAEAFDAPYSDSMGVLFRAYNYAALIPDRYLASLGQITGTGLVPPVFS